MFCLSFIGALAVKILLENKSKWTDETEKHKSHSTPILVVAYTNHALDQFLCHLLDYTKKIVRVGGRCAEEKLNEYLIRNLRKDVRINYFGRGLKSLITEAEKLSKLLIEEKRKIFNKHEFSFALFLSAFPREYQEKFLRDLSGYFSKYGIFFEDELHSNSLEDLFLSWKESSPITSKIFKRIMQNEKDLHKNNIKDSKQIDFTVFQMNDMDAAFKDQQIKEDYESSETDDSEELEDFYFVENRKLETDFNDFKLDFDEIEASRLNFFYLCEEEIENLKFIYFFHQKNIWNLTSSEKELLLKFAFYQSHNKKFAKYEDLIQRYLMNKRQKEEYYLEKDLAVFKDCEIIGMTVNFF